MKQILEKIASAKTMIELAEALSKSITDDDEYYYGRLKKSHSEILNYNCSRTFNGSKINEDTIYFSIKDYSFSKDFKNCSFDEKLELLKEIVPSDNEYKILFVATNIIIDSLKEDKSYFEYAHDLFEVMNILTKRFKNVHDFLILDTDRVGVKSSLNPVFEMFYGILYNSYTEDINGVYYNMRLLFKGSLKERSNIINRLAKHCSTLSIYKKESSETLYKLYHLDYEDYSCRSAYFSKISSYDLLMQDSVDRDKVLKSDYSFKNHIDNILEDNGLDAVCNVVVSILNLKLKGRASAGKKRIYRMFKKYIDNIEDILISVEDRLTPDAQRRMLEFDVGSM